MRNQTILFAAVCAICFLFYRCGDSAGTTAAANSADSSGINLYAGYTSQVEWGRHLATICGCGDCHTPKKMGPHGPVDDSSLLFSGNQAQMTPPSVAPADLARGMAATNGLTAWTGPWGSSFAANITSDSTGIGNWSEEQFITCIRQGLYKGIAGSRPIMPPMPINSFRNMTDNELKALFAFLKMVDPIHNVVAEYQPPGRRP